MDWREVSRLANLREAKRKASQSRIERRRGKFQAVQASIHHRERGEIAKGGGGGYGHLNPRCTLKGGKMRPQHEGGEDRKEAQDYVHHSTWEAPRRGKVRDVRNSFRRLQEQESARRND